MILLLSGSSLWYIDSGPASSAASGWGAPAEGADFEPVRHAIAGQPIRLEIDRAEREIRIRNRGVNRDSTIVLHDQVVSTKRVPSGE